MNTDYLVIGAGAAGVKAVETLRLHKPQSTITLINGEDRLPYKRTKLSKCLAEGFTKDEFAVHPWEWYGQNGIDLLNGWTVMSLNAEVKTVNLFSPQSQESRTLGFGKVLLALGSSPHSAETPVFREVQDAETLRTFWAPQSIVRILGGGVLGVELVEQAVIMGKRTVLLARSGQLLKSDLNLPASKRLWGLLESHGVAVLIGAVAPGAGLHAAALGSPPRIELAKKAGLDFDLGILVDENFTTSKPDVYAAGDCCQRPNGRVCHLWHEAEDQGAAAARSMAGLPVQFDPRPYRLKLEVFGDYYFTMNRLATPPILERVLPGEPGSLEIYQAWYGEESGITGVVMAGDKPRAKIYEKAVLEKWPLARVLADLGASRKD